MADIELVIKISEEIRVNITRIGLHRIPDEQIRIVDAAIQSGTPLPKGHGRLFDERDIVNGNYEVIGNRIYELEPVIDKGGEQ